MRYDQHVSLIGIHRLKPVISFMRRNLLQRRIAKMSHNTIAPGSSRKAADDGALSYR
jgi:hypothetical protein